MHATCIFFSFAKISIAYTFEIIKVFHSSAAIARPVSILSMKFTVKKYSDFILALYFLKYFDLYLSRLQTSVFYWGDEL